MRQKPKHTLVAKVTFIKEWILVKRLIALASILSSVAAQADSFSEYIVEKQRLASSVAKVIESRQEAEDKLAVEKLKTKLEKLLGAIHFKKTPTAVSLQPSTLLQAYYESGCSDGIRFALDSKRSFLVSDLSILKTDDVKNNLLSNDEITRVTCNEGHFHRVLEIASVPTKNFNRVVALTGINAQDIGPFPPNALVILAYRGSRIYVTSSNLSLPSSMFDSCKEAWETREKVRKVPNEQIDHDNFVAYGKCVGQKLEDETKTISSIREMIHIQLDLVL